MSENGWVKLHRCLLDKAIWTTSTPEQKVILITILCLANHEEKQWIWQGEKFNCKPGQLITSSIKLAQKTGCSRQNVRTALNKFKNLEFLTYQSTKTGILVTLVNWEKYQARPEELTNKVTNDQPTANQDLTTNKKDKNYKNNKKLYGDFVKLTEVEYQKLCNRYGKENTDSKIEDMNNWLPQGSNSKKLTDHYRGLLKWIKKDAEKQPVKKEWRPPLI